ncbi:hypothetical protein H8744_16760 [Oscillospiraceae bacterium N12]|uniref:Uncharacterized protein n=1 Tax=Jilunia laotingensis TaxID=2763675 RepID=A0A926F611_9BACT|nr:hypothetical protein [Jilunia laotingensis]MBC8594863.1 hypothetical protein [Jilunia laotingensis]
MKNPLQRCIITGSHKEFLEMIVLLWEQGGLTLPGKNNFNKLADYIYKFYDVRDENNPERSITLESIRSETYLYHGEE